MKGFPELSKQLAVIVLHAKPQVGRVAGTSIECALTAATSKRCAFVVMVIWKYSDYHVVRLLAHTVNHILVSSCGSGCVASHDGGMGIEYSN